MSVTNDRKFEAEDKNTSTGTNEMTTKDPFALESGLVHSRFPHTPDPVPTNFKFANADPEPIDIICHITLNRSGCCNFQKFKCNCSFS